MNYTHLSLFVLCLPAAQDAPLAPAEENKVPCSSQLPATVGRIDLILGPMFAGKTSELLRRIHAHEVRYSPAIPAKTNGRNSEFDAQTLRT